MKNFQNKNILIVGQNGSGKSNFVDYLITSFIGENNPENLKLVLFDPKKVQFTQYGDIPHLISGIVHDSEEAKNSLRWLNEESFRRLRSTEDNSSIVVVIEELADYMMADKNFFGDYIEKITFTSDITKIYFIIATTRPSTEHVLTERILNCFPNRICFRLADEDVSLNVLGEKGIEELSHPGSCLIRSESIMEIEKFQMPFISDEEIAETISAIKRKYI